MKKIQKIRERTTGKIKYIRLFIQMLFILLGLSLIPISILTVIVNKNMAESVSHSVGMYSQQIVNQVDYTIEQLIHFPNQNLTKISSDSYIIPLIK